MIKKIITGVLFLFVTATIAVLVSTVSNASASPLYLDPTPTPIVAYWTDSPRTDSWTHGESDSCITLGGWSQEIDDWGDCPEIVAPENNIPAGVIITLNSKTYNGDSRMANASNTNWAKKFTDAWGDPYMAVSETICVGSSAGCTGVGLSADPDSDWEGYETDGDYNYLPDVYLKHQLGSSGSVNWTMTPIWYGDWDCTSVDPSNREFISSGLLLGDDDEGETFRLSPGDEYVLYTAEGPWNDGVDDRYDISVRFKTPHTTNPPAGEWGEWTPLVSVEGEDICDDDFLDANGSALVFIADETTAQIQFRVNDVEDEFEDNSGDVEYYFLGGEGSSQGCEDTYTVGSKVAGHTVTANIDIKWDLSAFYSGGNYNGRVGPGETYLYKVTGSYDDNGVESNDTIVYAGPNGSPWTDPNDAFLNSNEQCEDENSTGISFYGVTKSSWDYDVSNSVLVGSKPYFEINDDGGNKADNSGNITAEWYESVWTPPPSTCATKYTIGTFIESPIFFATNSFGQEYPQSINGLIVGQVYYLESQGTPYSLDGDPSYDFEVGTELDVVNSVIWQDPEVWADCVTAIDTDRNGYYFTATETTFWLRAESTLFGHDENSGTLKFNLHGAVPNEVPDGENCSDYYDFDKIVWRGSFDADENSGVAIDHSVFDPHSRYAIKITETYTDPDGTGKQGEIRRSYPTQGSVDWEDFEDWEGGICYQADVSGYDVVYFEASALSDYEVRANTPTGNSGTFSYEVWSLDQTQSTNLGCEYDYVDIDGWYLVKDKDEIIANNAGIEYDDDDNISAVTGYVMATDFSTDAHTYKFETDYLNGDVNLFKWNLQISADGGSTWIFLEDWADCYIHLESETSPVKRGYFTTPVDDPGPFILRVYDAGETYWNNVGGVDFSLWIDDVSADPGDVWGTEIYDPNAWGAGCGVPCPSPGFLNVGEWVEFARCRFTSWLSWCPWHSETIDEISDAFATVEPFQTISELMSLGSLIREEMSNYTWTNDEGGSGDGVAEMRTPPGLFFMPVDQGGAGIDPGYITGPDTIWGSGVIDLTPDETITFKTTCNMELANSLGTRLATPMCFGFNVLDQLGLRLWFQMFWDFFMLIMLVMYIKKSWVDKLQ